MTNLERHQEIVAGSDVDIYAISDSDRYQDKQIYDIFYRTCLEVGELEPDADNINRTVVQKLHLWGFSPRRVKRIMKYATAEYAPVYLEMWRKETPFVVGLFEEMIKDVTKAAATTAYEKCFIAAAHEMHYNDGKFIWFELDRSIAQKLYEQGVGKEDIKDILQSESFLLENKLYASGMAEVIVRQMNSLPAENRPAGTAQNQVNSVTYSNTYQNCTIFLAYNHEAEKDLQHFLERIGDIKLLTFDMTRAAAADMPIAEQEAEQEQKAGPPQELERTDKPEPLPEPDDQLDEAEPADQLDEATPLNTDSSAAKQIPEPVEPVLSDTVSVLPKDAPAAAPPIWEPAKTTLKNGARKELKPDISNLSNFRTVDDFNDNLMKIKNYEIIAGVSGSTAEHQYRAGAHELFVKNKIWNVDMEIILAKRLLSQKMSKLVLQNAMIKYSPLFDSQEESEAKRKAKEVITAAISPDVAPTVDEPPVESSSAHNGAAEIFLPAPEAAAPASEDINSFYYDAISNFRTSKSYQDLTAAEKYLHLAQNLLAEKGIRHWQSADDAQIAAILLNESISREQIASVLAENTPAETENRMDYADEVLSRISAADLPAIPKTDFAPEKSQSVAVDKSMEEGLERIRSAQIPDIFFEDLSFGMKYLYYAKPLCKDAWNQENDIKIAKLLVKAGLTDNVIQGVIESYSPLVYAATHSEQRVYSQKIINSVREGAI
jgi:hypothetical protein